MALLGQLRQRVDLKMDFDTPASTQMPSPPQWPAVTLTFDLQNVIRSSVGGQWIFR